MDRYILSDRLWASVAPLCSGRKEDPGKTGGDARLFLEGVLWIARTGSPWRDLPSEFGQWNSVFKRFRRRVQNGTFDRVFNALACSDPDPEYVMIDGTISKVHRHGQCAKGGRKRGAQNQAIGKSGGGLTTKILALVDGLGNLARFILMPRTAR